LAAIIVEEKLELVAPFLPINKHQESSTTRERERERESERQRETDRRREGLPMTAALLPLQ
jgi:hypothetical protein